MVRFANMLKVAASTSVCSLSMKHQETVCLRDPQVKNRPKHGTSAFN